MTRKLSDAGVKKAAQLLVALGPEAAAAVTQHLDGAEMEAIAREIARTPEVPSARRRELLREFHEMYRTRAYPAEGGLEYAREMLEKSVGADRAREVLASVRGGLEQTTLGAVEAVDPDQVFAFLENEHPQTMALILARLEAPQAGAVLTRLPPEIQPDVVARMATMEPISQETFADVDRILRERLRLLAAAAGSPLGGVELVAQVLNCVDRSTEQNIMAILEREDPELSSRIKNLMFVFEDLVHLLDRDVQQLLKEVDSKDLALALKAASETVKEKVFKNMSQRAGEMLRDEIEYLGPVRLKSVEEAQQRIVEVIRRLEEQGKIVIARGGEEEILV